MEKVIEKLEKEVLGIESIEKEYYRELETLNSRVKECEEGIENKRQYIEELKSVLAITEKVKNDTHDYLLHELERTRRNKEREEKNLVWIRKEISDIEKARCEVSNRIEEFNADIMQLKRINSKPIETAEDAVNEVSKAFEAIGAISEETSKAVGNITLGGSLPICEVKIDMDDTLKILKESFPTIEDFLKFAYGESAVKEHSKNMQEAIAGGLTAGLIARRLKDVNLK